MSEVEGNVETYGGENLLLELTPSKPRRPNIQFRKKEVDPAKCQEISSSSTDEGLDIAIIFVVAGKAMKTWDNTTKNKFTRYALMV